MLAFALLTIFAASVTEVSATIQQSTFKAGITPIAESSVPANGNPAIDTCSSAALNSCDSCATDAGEYCHFAETGAVRCCRPSASVSVSSSSTTSDDSNGAHLWRSLSSIVYGMWGDKTQTTKSESSSAIVSPLTSESEPESGSVQPSKNEIEAESGAITPSKVETEAESGSVRPLTSEAEPESAAIKPIRENPIPSAASSSDVCSSKRSCDACMAEQYCRYSTSGKASCCTLAAGAVASSSPVAVSKSAAGSVVPLTSEMEPESAAVTPLRTEVEPESAAIDPIKSNPIPTWASSSDVCIGSDSCDSCDMKGYCKYDLPSGDAKCCVKSSDAALVQPSVKANKMSGSISQSSSAAEAESGSVQPSKVETEAESASISPIRSAHEPESASNGAFKANPIPKWASSADVCLEITSCDSCGQAQYCRYSSVGKASCCGKMIAQM